MSNYTLNNLEPGTFENIIQSLCQGIFGLKLKIYGAGTDGQREAVFDGEKNFDTIGVQLSGRSIFQAKYKSSMTKKDDYTWLREELKKELEGFKEKCKTEPEYMPNNYLFFTNIVLTPQKDSGIKDKVDKFVGSYNDIIPNIYIIGYDEICAMLDNNREVATSYSSFIYSGDVLAKLYNYISFKENISIETLMRFMEKEFQDDSLSRMEQAGMLTENRLSLQRVFVDLQVSDGMVVANSKKSGCKFVQKIIQRGNSINRNKESNNEIKDNKYVLMGNAGQGKSTLCQFISQIYRAFFLMNISNCPISKSVNNFIKDFKSNYNYNVDCFRIPIRIVLKDYADWISKNENNNENYSVINYILNKIRIKDGSSILIDDFRVLLSKYSWIFIFDGLDEVPSSSNRELVLREISNFVDIDLRRQECDNIVISTSRPQGYGQSFESNNYTHLQLAEMDNNLCMSYLEKLMKNMEPNEEKRKEYLNTLEEAIQNNIISRLMRTPLQATIIAILVKSGGKPPKNRYSLFTEYYHTIVNREKQKGIIETLNDDLGWIDDIHYKIGFMLQRESEISKNPSAVLEKNKFVEIIKEYIIEKEDEYKDNICIIDNKAKLLFEIIVLRLTFISEFQDDIYGFSIRSIQEFFAANYLTKNQQEQTIVKTIKEISLSAYWRNVLLFALGYINKERIYLEGNIDSLCGELNGSDLESNEFTTNSVVYAGSWLALDILVEGIFKSSPKIENKYLSKIGELFELEITEKFISITLLSPNLIQKLLCNQIVHYLELNPNNRSVWYMLGLLYKSNNQEALTIIRQFWPVNDFSAVVVNIYVHQLRLLEIDDKENIDWLFKKICTCKFYDNIFLNLRQCEKFARYILRNPVQNEIRSYLLKNTLLSLKDVRSEDKNSCECLNKLFDIDIIMLGEELNLFQNNYVGDSTDIVDGYNIYLKLINDVSENIEMIEHTKSVLKEHNVNYYYEYINFCIKPNYKNLVNFIKAYVNENDEFKKLVREQLSEANWILEYISNIYLRNNKSTDLINMYDNKVEDNEWIHIENTLSRIMQEKDIIAFKNNEFLKYTSGGYSMRDEVLQKFIKELEVDFERLHEYSKAFVAQLIFIVAMSIESVGYKLSSNEIIEYKDIRKLYDFYIKTTFEEKWVKRWQRIITLFIILSSNNNDLLKDGELNNYSEFEERGIYEVFSQDLSNEIVEEVLNKILNTVSFSKKEMNILKVIPFLLAHRYIDYSKIQININELNNIQCIDKYNRFGKLIICSLYSDNNNIIRDLSQLAQESDNLYLYEELILIYDKIPMKSNLQELVLINLYHQLKGLTKTSEERITMLAKYENELLNISSSKISDIDMVI